MFFYNVPEWWNGRHIGLKIRRSQGRAGSNPASGTTMTMKKTDDIRFLNDYPDDIDKKVSQLIYDYQSTHNPNQRHKLAETVVERLSQFSFSFPVEFRHEHSFYRGRKVQHPQQLYPTIGELSYPPNSENVKLGRANFDGQQILYSCFSITEVYSELACKQDDAINLLRFRPKRDVKVFFTPIGQLNSVRRFHRVDVGSEVYLNLMLEQLQRLKAPVARACCLVDAFFADEFSKPDPNHNDTDISQYHLTSLIANKLYEDDRVDGIVYPSVQYSGGYNFAIKAKSFDSKFEPEQYEGNIVRHVLGYGIREIATYAFGNSVKEDGALTWARLETAPHKE